MQKEFTKMLKSIGEWEKKNEGNVCFIGNFISFDKENKILDGRYVGYGERKDVKVLMENIEDAFKEDKEKFINW